MLDLIMIVLVLTALATALLLAVAADLRSWQAVRHGRPVHADRQGWRTPDA